MAAEWRKTTLGEICQLRAGTVFPPALQGKPTGKYPFAKVSDMNLAANAECIHDANNWVDDSDLPQLRAKPVPPGTTVFAKIGEALKANRLRFIVRPTIIDNNVMGAIPAVESVDPRFFFYALSQFDFGELAGGTALPYLTVGGLSQLEMSLPPLPEQRAIAHILGTLDDKIQLNRRMSETLEAMARSLFKAWFVDFEPVRAKAEGRHPDLPKPLADLFPDAFEDSPTGEIPAGWKAAALREWVDVLSGGTPPRATRAYWDGSVPWISPKVMTAIHADEVEMHVSEAAIGNGTRLAPALSTLVMVRGMGLHESVRVCQARRAVTFNQDVKALVGTSIEPTLLLFSLLDAQAVLLDRVESAGHGTGKIPTEVLLSLPVVMPDDASQRHLAPPLCALNDRIEATRVESRALAAVRDALLPKLIAGELRVRDADRIVTNVA